MDKDKSTLFSYNILLEDIMQLSKHKENFSIYLRSVFKVIFLFKKRIYQQEVTMKQWVLTEVRFMK
jgi:hypothetical protein